MTATPASAPTLTGMSDGIIGKDDGIWTIVCRDCGGTCSGESLLAVIREREMLFHASGWPNGSNPRLCADCRLARGCHCHACEEERVEA